MRRKHRSLYFLSLLGGIIAIVHTHCSYNTYAQGKVLYEAYCSPCHMNDGSGLSLLYPSLLDNERLDSIQSKIPCLIRLGQPPRDSIPNSGMQAFPKLSNIEISNIMNYINTQIAGRVKPVDIKDVNEYLEKCDNN